MKSYHDEMFKSNFTKKENAIDLINNTFPEEIKNNLLFETLTLGNNSYTDSKLKKYFSDLVYTCNYKNVEIKIALLFEHKSYFTDRPHLQLLKYILRIWEQQIKSKEEMKVVIPIIFYHGLETWKYSRLNEYFTEIDSNLIKFIPIFDYLLIDLSGYTDQEIKDKLFDSIENKILLSIMKNILDKKKFIKNITDYLEIGKIYFKTEKGIKFIETVIEYLFSVVKEDKKEIIIEKIDKIIKDGGETMTIAMRLRKDGKIEGKIEEKQETLIRLLSKKFGMRDDEKQFINNCFDAEKLDNALDEFVFADNKIKVLNCLK